MRPVVMPLHVMLRLVTLPHATLLRVMLQPVMRQHAMLRHKSGVRSFN